MITISQSKDILVRDVKCASFIFKYKHRDKVYSVDLNPKNYISGGSLSTGLFFTDMALYAMDVINKIHSSIGEKLLTFDDLKNASSEFDSKYDCIIFEDIEASNEFEVLAGVPQNMFWLQMFVPRLDKFESSLNELLNIKMKKDIRIGTYVLLDLMYRIFIYSTNQRARDILTAHACYVFSEYHYVRGIALSSFSNVILIFDKYINDYIQIQAPTFMAKLVYPLSPGNRTVASLGEECVSYLDSFQLFKTGGFDIDARNHLEVADICVLTTSNMSANSSRNKNNENIFNLSGYKALVGSEEYLIGATLYADYDIHNTLSHAICLVFNEPEKRNIQFITDILNSDVMKFTYDDIIFGKNINDIINHDKVKLGMSYTGYTKSGGGRRYDYDTLRNKKISPTSRRDLLNDIVLDIIKNSSIEKVPFFRKLDVDFKRFYGFIKK